MTLSNEDRKTLIKNYAEKGQATIEKVRFLIDNSEFALAVNRIYYGIYYMLSALALKNHHETSKHAQLISWFNKVFVKEGIVNEKYGKMIRKSFENRMEGDYNVLSNFPRDEVEQAFKEMKDVISEIQKLI